MIHYFDAHLVNDDGEGVEISVLQPYQNILPKHLINTPLITPSKHTLSTYPTNTPYQHTLSTHLTNIPYQHTLPTHPLNTPNQHTLPTHALNTPLITPCQHTTNHTLPTHLLNTPFQHPSEHTLSTHFINTPPGEGIEIKNAVCMHEEDAGLGWKHTDWRSGNTILPYQYTLTIHPQHTLSTPPINTRIGARVTTYPINTSYQHTLLTHPINAPYQPTLLTHHLNTSYQHTLTLPPYQPTHLLTHSFTLSLPPHLGKSQLRRTRRLVVSFMTTIANFHHSTPSLNPPP